MESFGRFAGRDERSLSPFVGYTVFEPNEHGALAAVHRHRGIETVGVLDVGDMLGTDFLKNVEHLAADERLRHLRHPDPRTPLDPPDSLSIHPDVSDAAGGGMAGALPWPRSRGIRACFRRSTRDH